MSKSHPAGSGRDSGGAGIGTWTCGLVAAALLLAAAPASAQIPNPAAAINAAKDARAKTEAAQKKNSDALQSTGSGQGQQAGEKPASGTPAAGQQPAPAEMPGDKAGQAGYSYDPAGRRDPFVSLLGRGGDLPASGAARPQGLPGMLISELNVKGVLKTANGNVVALLQGPDNKTYIAHSGDKVMDGAIKAISAAEVVFTQDVNDPLSLVKQREVRKAIRSEAR